MKSHPKSDSIYKTHRIVVDLRNQYTEFGWTVIIDKFVLAVVPWLFTVIGWILVIGGLRYIGTVGDAGFAVDIADGLGILMFFYFIGVFWRFEIRGIPFLRTAVAWRNASTVLAIVLAWLAWFLSRNLASVVVLAQSAG